LNSHSRPLSQLNPHLTSVQGGLTNNSSKGTTLKNRILAELRDFMLSERCKLSKVTNRVSNEAFDKYIGTRAILRRSSFRAPLRGPRGRSPSLPYHANGELR